MNDYSGNDETGEVVLEIGRLTGLNMAMWQVGNCVCVAHERDGAIRIKWDVSPYAETPSETAQETV